MHRGAFWLGKALRARASDAAKSPINSISKARTGKIAREATNKLRKKVLQRRSVLHLGGDDVAKDSALDREAEAATSAVDKQEALLSETVGAAKAAKAKLEATMAELREEGKAALSAKDREISEMRQQISGLELEKSKRRELEAEAEKSELDDLKKLLLGLHAKTDGLHSKADILQADVSEIKSDTQAIQKTFQNFLTSESPVPRFILMGTPLSSSTPALGSKRLDSFLSSFMMSDTTATCYVLCAHDLSSAVSFEIKEPKKWIKEHAPAIKIGLKGKSEAS